MSPTLDAGALIAFERDERGVVSIAKRALQARLGPELRIVAV